MSIEASDKLSSIGLENWSPDGCLLTSHFHVLARCLTRAHEIDNWGFYVAVLLCWDLCWLHYEAGWSERQKQIIASWSKWKPQGRDIFLTELRSILHSVDSCSLQQQRVSDLLRIVILMEMKEDWWWKRWQRFQMLKWRLWKFVHKWMPKRSITVSTEIGHNLRSPQTPFHAQRQVVGPRLWVHFQSTQCMCNKKLAPTGGQVVVLVSKKFKTTYKPLCLLKLAILIN